MTTPVLNLSLASVVSGKLLAHHSNTFCPVFGIVYPRPSKQHVVYDEPASDDPCQTSNNSTSNVRSYLMLVLSFMANLESTEATSQRPFDARADVDHASCTAIRMHNPEFHEAHQRSAPASALTLLVADVGRRVALEVADPL
ncbi:hypothetical protein C8Q70DRAFT_931650 [Cubamyces menziesii]|nr:hypothetical protein C8Q70DRAFT_931650 [Cubamyces menziesii]